MGKAKGHLPKICQQSPDFLVSHNCFGEPADAVYKYLYCSYVVGQQAIKARLARELLWPMRNNTAQQVSGDDLPLLLL